MSVNSAVAQSSSAIPLSLGVAGLGGLGVVGLTRLIASTLQRRYPRVVSTETRGIAQRRAPVRATLRAGHRVRSPLLGGAPLDLMLVLESGEALRWRQDIGPGTRCVVSDLVIRPSGQAEQAPLVSPDEVARVLREAGAEVTELRMADWLAEQGHPAHASATVAFGAFVRRLGFSRADCLALLDSQVPAASRAMNHAAFEHGYSAIDGAALPAFCRARHAEAPDFAHLAAA